MFSKKNSDYVPSTPENQPQAAAQPIQSASPAPAAELVTGRLPQIPSSERTSRGPGQSSPPSDEPPSRVNQVISQMSLKMGVAQAAFYACLGGLAYGAVMLLQHGEQTTRIGMLYGAFAALSLFRTIPEHGAKKVIALADLSWQQLGQACRVDEVLKRVFLERKIARPDLAIVGKTSNADVTVHPFGPRGVFTINERLLDMLNERELKAVVERGAVEKSMGYEVMMPTMPRIEALSQLMALGACVGHVLATVGPGENKMLLAPFMIGAAAFSQAITALPLRLMSAYYRRQRELKMDVASCRITKDPESLISALGTVESIKSPSLSQRVFETLGLSNRPTHAERIRTIKEAFGIKPQGTSEEG
jgi:Zn-dependent protease with chaperone function